MQRGDNFPLATTDEKLGKRLGLEPRVRTGNRASSLGSAIELRAINLNQAGGREGAAQTS